MSKFSYRKNEQQQLIVTGSLEGLLENIEPGMNLNGVVLNKLDSDQYLIRVRGVNILTLSEYELKTGQKVTMVVHQVDPHLLLELVLEKSNSAVSALVGRTDLWI